MSPSLRVIGIVTVLLILPAAGCGGSDFVGKANGICKTYNAKIRAVPIPKSLSGVAGYLEKTAPLAAEGIAKLKAIKPPRDKASAYQGFLSGLGREVAVTQQANAAVNAGRPMEAASLLQQQAGLSKEDDVKAKAAGLKECAGG